MSKKLDKLREEAIGLGLTLTGEEKELDLRGMIDSKMEQIAADADDGEGEGEIVSEATPGAESGAEAPGAEVVPPITKTPKSTTGAEGEQMVPLSIVQKMINEAIAANNPANQSKPKKTRHHDAHVWRFDGKWVVDFLDRNVDPETGKKVDPYIKEKIHAYNVFNEQTRTFDAWIGLVFHDGTGKNIPLKTYVQRRVPVYCRIVERHKIDKSYSIGEVETKTEKDGRLVGTGVLVDQEVIMHEEVFEIQTPEGEKYKIPAYAIT